MFEWLRIQPLRLIQAFKDSFGPIHGDGDWVRPKVPPIEVNIPVNFVIVPRVTRLSADAITVDKIVTGAYTLPTPIESGIINMTESTSYDESKDIKAHIANTAKSITNGARRSAYGTPEQNFERIAKFWNDFLINRGIIDTPMVTPTDVSLMMVLMKVARLCETPDHLDSFVDMVGYTLTAAEAQGVVVPTDE